MTPKKKKTEAKKKSKVEPPSPRLRPSRSRKSKVETEELSLDELDGVEGEEGIEGEEGTEATEETKETKATPNQDDSGQAKVTKDSSDNESTKLGAEKKKDAGGSLGRIRQWWSVMARKDRGEEVPDDTPEELDEAGAFTLRVKEQKRVSGLAAFFKTINYFGMGKYRHGFIQSLALMLNAGLSLIDAMEAIGAEVRAKAMKKLIGQLTQKVRSGMPLWRSMEQTYFFTPYEIALVHIGEDAGNLAKNLAYLSEQQEKDHALKQKVKMAMIYPTIVLVMVFVIIMGLGMFVLPSLVQVLFSMNVELPLSTRIIIKITGYFENYGMLIAPGCIAFFILILLLTKFTRFKVVTQWFLFKIPGIGRLAREATIARFGVILGGLLRAGVPLVEALESLAEVTQVVSYQKFYTELLHHIKVGDSFSKSFVAIKSTKRLLPVSVQQLVVTGERSGTLSQTLLKIAEIYEQKAEETAEKLPVILEPMLLLLIGSIVGGIAFSIITPIYSVVGNVGGG